MVAELNYWERGSAGEACSIKTCSQRAVPKRDGLRHNHTSKRGKQGAVGLGTRQT